MVSQLAASNGSGYAPALLERLRGLRRHMATNIQGQEHIFDRVVSVLTRGELGFAHPRRPRGSFLFVGPTGVGKTETTNVFTGYLFDEAIPIRFDMSEYQLQKAVEKLIGESRSDRGLLGRSLSDVSRGVLLFDEIEKAHPLVLDLFLQVLEDARITLATGAVLDLRGFYVVFTSNIGSEESMRMENAPFASIERTVLMRVRERLRPELAGRVNEIVVFSRLDYATQRAICADMVDGEIARFSALGYGVEMSADAMEFLLRAGYHRLLGARPMRGAVERFMQDALSDAILRGEETSGQLVVSSDGGQLVLVPRGA